MLTASDIRRQFLEFFQNKGHHIVPSAPIVVKNDPTLLFTNAGMNQFKDYFLGNRQSPFPRVADTQKCLRVSGKHNDLEEVGVDTYHHTMFEMLGNWSFGDYFKKEAIAWSWELLTKVYGIPEDQLYVSVFEGDEAEGLPRDEEAWELWKNLVPEERIVLGSKKDNFWEMGDTGPCGPCSEIHVDCRTAEERRDGKGKRLVNADHPQVIEIWNNVFMQYNRRKDGSLQSLPAQHVDTGMGFERLVRVLQQKQSNYDTDVFSETIKEVGRITGHAYDASDSKAAVSFRVIADHIRAIAFTIADGQLPSNTGAGYVIRRILRRAVRYYFTYLNYKQPLLHQLLPLLAAQFQEVFPELDKQLDFITRVVREEEDAFLRTLDKGLRRLDDAMRQAKENQIAGNVAFELYDTYGFPLDLTRLIASENKLTVDEAGFDAEMLQQKSRSRAATALDTGDWTIVKEGSESQFTGYNSLEEEAQILKYRQVKAKGKSSYQLVLNRTPFYAESGGQVGDRGVLLLQGGEIEIFDTKKENDLIIHFTETLPEQLEGRLVAKVDHKLRRDTELHHSATHLLHAALREVLGNHVAQKGSLVNEFQLRFDFSHFGKMNSEEIQQVEQKVNEKIRQNLAVIIQELPKEQAIEMGAMALFGEKYSDVVRVVVMDPTYSIELCGGTHVRHTGEIGYFKIKSEAAVAAGVRRIEALSGGAAEAFVNAQLNELQEAKALIKHSGSLNTALEAMLEEQGVLKKKLESLEAKSIAAMANTLALQMETIAGIDYLGKVVKVSSGESLRKLALDLKAALGEHSLVVLAADIEGKAAVAVSIGDALVNDHNLDAAKIIKAHFAPRIKGGGGGQKTLATAGGQDVSQLEDAMEAVKKSLN